MSGRSITLFELNSARSSVSQVSIKMPARHFPPHSSRHKEKTSDSPWLRQWPLLINRFYFHLLLLLVAPHVAPNPAMSNSTCSTTASQLWKNRLTNIKNSFLGSPRFHRRKLQGGWQVSFSLSLTIANAPISPLQFRPMRCI